MKASFSFLPLLCLFIQFYLQSRFTWHGARLLRPLVQFTLLMMAFYTGLSRVSDHKHHPTDVLAGFVQGALVAYCIVSTSCLSSLSSSHHFLPMYTLMGHFNLSCLSWLVESSQIYFKYQYITYSILNSSISQLHLSYKSQSQSYLCFVVEIYF